MASGRFASATVVALIARNANGIACPRTIPTIMQNATYSVRIRSNRAVEMVRAYVTPEMEAKGLAVIMGAIAAGTERQAAP